MVGLVYQQERGRETEMNQRMAHGIDFTSCPECNVPTGTRGLARHRTQAHGVAPAVKGRKPKALTTAEASALRKAIAEGSIPTATIGFGLLLKAGFVTATGHVTVAGRARLAGK
jgi:hypothetical protein